MRKLVLKMSITVDGFICGPNGEMDWFLPYRSPEGIAWLTENLWEADVHIMGSRAYQDMAAYWPYSDDPIAPPLNEIPKIIFSRSGPVTPHAARTTAPLKPASPAALAGWTEPTFATGEIVSEITALKQKEGKVIYAHGGVRFAQSLVAHGLVDEFRFVVTPIAIGRGLSLFSQLPKSLGLKLVSSKSFSTGTMANVYVPA